MHLESACVYPFYYYDSLTSSVASSIAYPRTVGPAGRAHRGGSRSGRTTSSSCSSWLWIGGARSPWSGSSCWAARKVPWIGFHRDLNYMPYQGRDTYNLQFWVSQSDIHKSAHRLRWLQLIYTYILVECTTVSAKWCIIINVSSEVNCMWSWMIKHSGTWVIFGVLRCFSKSRIDVEGFKVLY